MIFTINDLALNCQVESPYDALKNLRILIDIIKKLKSLGLLTKLSTDKKICGIKLAPNYYLEKSLNSNDLTKDEKLYLKTILINANIITVEDKIRFIMNDVSSSLLGYTYIHNAFTISLNTNDIFSSPFLSGQLKVISTMSPVNLNNISKPEHVQLHKDYLGIRIYESNPKHKVNYGWGSSMDLDDLEAQKVLDTAIATPNNKNHLINYYNNKYYSFRRHHSNCFHGYINENLPENFRTLLEQYK